MRFLKYILFFGCFFSLFAQNKPQLLWNTYTFFVPNKPFAQKCYTEISLSISPNHLNVQRSQDSSFFVAVSGIIEIYDEKQIIKRDSFVVKNPSVRAIEKLSDFAYIKRYWLENNKTYRVLLQLKDYFSKDTLSIFKANKQIQTHFDENKICLSDVQFIDFIEKASSEDMFFKYGYTIVPYNDNYFDETFNTLSFSFEIYNTDTVFGKAEPFFIAYSILNKDDNKLIENIGAIKKMNASKVNVVIGKLPISSLPSGNYYLIIELKNKNNQPIHKEQVYLQRKNLKVVNNSTLNEELFFGNQNNVDTLKMWLEALWPIANNIEKDWIINQSIQKDAQIMKNLMIDFWQKRAADSASPVSMAKVYYSKLNYVMKNFKCGKIAPYYTDRGRVYMQYGEPNQRTIQLSETGAYPYEIWQYYRIYDAATNQFFTNRRFVFSNKGIADECYSLIHSDMKGEYNNPNWQREIMKRELYDINNPYQQQKINYGNNFDKLYQNPQ